MPVWGAPKEAFAEGIKRILQREQRPDLVVRLDAWMQDALERLNVTTLGPNARPLRDEPRTSRP